MSKYIAQDRIRAAVARLAAFRSAVHSQKAQHLIPFFALKEKGAAGGGPIVFEEADDFAFWDRYFEVDPNSREGKYYDPLLGARRISGHPHSNVATARKSTFVSSWNAATIDTSAGDTRYALGDDYVSIIQKEALTKRGRSERLPLIDLAVWMFRHERFDSASTAADVVERMSTSFNLTSDELAQLFDPSTTDEDEGTFWQTAVVSRTEILGMLPTPEVSTREEAPVAMSRGEIAPLPASVVPLIVSPRLLRMARLAVASSQAVLFVGPPGTGKSALVDQLVREASANPGSFGLTGGINAPLWVTPEESWTARELLGGDSLGDDHALVFRAGCLLQAIREDRWLILDEANRADLDRIFGGALTWLSADRGQQVLVGRVSNSPKSGEVLLAWGEDPASEVDGGEGLGDPEHAGDVVFRAGTDWRLLGTYNALDAMRVFRLGHALGRRFSRVPVPPLSASEFAGLVADATRGLDENTQAALASFYGAHLADEATAMGPALFLRMGRYVLAGQADTTYAPGDLRDLIAEAYVVNVGPWLATMDEADQDRLAEALQAAGTIDAGEWEWILRMSSHLS
jgi:hypothetical protein